MGDDGAQLGFGGDLVVAGEQGGFVEGSGGGLTHF